MTTHATALARLTGARTQHTLSDATADVFAEILATHPDEHEGIRHILGKSECRAYLLVLAALGIGGAS